MQFLERHNEVIGLVTLVATISVFVALFLWERFRYKRKLRSERFAQRIESGGNKIINPKSFFENILKDLKTSLGENKDIGVQNEGNTIFIIYLPTNRKMIEITFSKTHFNKPVTVVFGAEGEKSYPKKYTYKEMEEVFDPLKKTVLEFAEEMSAHKEA